MQLKKGNNIFLLISLAILVSSPLVFAGFGDWWASFTGRATQQSSVLGVVVGNTAPTIVNVSVNTANSINVEGAWTTVYVSFNATDADGIDNLADATAKLRINASSGGQYLNSSCAHITDLLWGSTTVAFYNCSAYVAYFEAAGALTVNVSVSDINGAYAENNTLTWTQQTVTAFTSNITALNWSSVSTSSINVSADNNPYFLNNSGNADTLEINLTGYDLKGVTVSTEIIGANNFTADDLSAGCSGNGIVNASSRQITGASLNRGNGAPGQTDAEQIFLCLQDINNHLSAQTFDTYSNLPWVIEVNQL